ncbi:transposable element Tcb2 transposase [Trichonephila clavipes]|nr:transposable element Tcb2 transposase [Trichonephila clavipes]
MNPIEHVWDALGRRVAGRQPPPQTLQELERALLEEWDRIPQLVINSLIDSMPQRCSTLLALTCGFLEAKWEIELLSFANPLDYAILDIRLDLVLNVRKRDLSPTALHAIALETINTRFPPEEWLHIYTDGSLLDFAQGAGIGVFSHLFSFYLHAGPLTTHFDASRVACDKPWSTLCKKSHGIPSSPRAAAVAKFRLLTGHDCLCAHLFRFNLVISPICVLCDTGQDMTAAHLDECSALNDLNCNGCLDAEDHSTIVNDESSSGFTPRETISAGFCTEGTCFHSKFSVRVYILETRLPPNVFS